MIRLVLFLTISFLYVPAQVLNERDLKDPNFLKILFQFGQPEGDSQTRAIQGSNICESYTSQDVSLDSYSLKFSDVKLMYNDHVGNDWYYYTKIGETVLREGDKVNIDIRKGERIKIFSCLKETKEKHIDSNKVESYLSYDDFVRFSNSGFYVEVKIRESNGRYAGNTAMMRFYYEVE